MKKILYVLMAVYCLAACDLDELPKSEVSKEPVFGSEAGLELYSNSFYDILPDASSASHGDKITDYTVQKSVPDFLREGAYGPQQHDEWETKHWKELRKINYFIENCVSEEISESVKNHYIGLARFFRAWFYFDKVKMYGDVPWIDKAMDVDDPALYGPRDPRTLVMENVLADLDFAANNITLMSDGTSSQITKYVVLAFKSRVCLFEGTFRKYHAKYNLASTADTWLNEAVKAAQEVMTDGGFSINKVGNQPYRNLFISNAAISSEVILAAVCDQELAVLNDANWYWTSATYGDRANLPRNFIHTYLMLDGTPFTNIPGYETMQFFDETQNRDKRLAQTIRTPGYQRIDGGTIVAAPPVFSYTYTGYQPIKFCLDDMYYDGGKRNINTIPIIRYAEVLLNYAEAKAELGQLSDSDWASTVGELRDRAGITGGLSSKPTTIDPYLQTVYFPEISDPSLLEIRRERGIELVYEGLRMADLIRWRKGNLVSLEWNGIYVPGLNIPLDLDGDGILDVCFVDGEPANKLDGVDYINVGATLADGSVNPQRLSERTRGNLTWLNNIPRVWDEKHYLYPIPQMAIIINPALEQNDGWEIK